MKILSPCLPALLLCSPWLNYCIVLMASGGFLWKVVIVIVIVLSFSYSGVVVRALFFFFFCYFTLPQFLLRLLLLIIIIIVIIIIFIFIIIISYYSLEQWLAYISSSSCFLLLLLLLSWWGLSFAILPLSLSSFSCIYASSLLLSFLFSPLLHPRCFFLFILLPLLFLLLPFLFYSPCFLFPFVRPSLSLSLPRYLSLPLPYDSLGNVIRKMWGKTQRLALSTVRLALSLSLSLSPFNIEMYD